MFQIRTYIMYNCMHYYHALNTACFMAVVCLSLHVVTVTAAGPLCLSCNSVVSPKTCTTVKQCGHYEKCYTESFVNEIGSLRYKLGCRDSNMCPSIGRRSVRAGFLICLECCDGEICNNQGCGFEELSRDQRGPVCFACQYQADIGSCGTVHHCGRDEVCLLKQELDDSGQLLYHSGCEEKDLCLREYNLIEKYIGRKRRNIDKAVLIGSQCKIKCCDADFCNRNCKVADSEPTTTLATSTTMPLRTTLKLTDRLTTLPTSTPVSTTKTTTTSTTSKRTTTKPTTTATTPTTTFPTTSEATTTVSSTTTATSTTPMTTPLTTTTEPTTTVPTTTKQTRTLAATAAPTTATIASPTTTIPKTITTSPTTTSTRPTSSTARTSTFMTSMPSTTPSTNSTTLPNIPTATTTTSPSSTTPTVTTTTPTTSTTVPTTTTPATSSTTATTRTTTAPTRPTTTVPTTKTTNATTAITTHTSTEPTTTTTTTATTPTTSTTTKPTTTFPTTTTPTITATTTTTSSTNYPTITFPTTTFPTTKLPTTTLPTPTTATPTTPITTPKPTTTTRPSTTRHHSNCIERWTPYFNRKGPYGTGDREVITDSDRKFYCRHGVLTSVDCVTRSGAPASSTGQIVHCDLQTGLRCINAENLPNPCHDYKIRYLCTCLDL